MPSPNDDENPYVKLEEMRPEKKECKEHIPFYKDNGFLVGYALVAIAHAIFFCWLVYEIVQGAPYKERREAFGVQLVNCMFILGAPTWSLFWIIVDPLFLIALAFMIFREENECDFGLCI